MDEFKESLREAQKELGAFDKKTESKYCQAILRFKLHLCPLCCLYCPIICSDPKCWRKSSLVSCENRITATEFLVEKLDPNFKRWVE